VAGLQRAELLHGEVVEMALNVIIGARETAQPGWISTDLRSNEAPLDMRRAEDWAKRFAPGSIDRILLEHALEHVWPEEAEEACRNFYRYLKPGGRVRIAVPDAFNPDPHYQEHSRPGGLYQWIARLFHYAPDEPMHKTHWDFQSLSAMLGRVGFQVVLLEYFDAAGRFHRNAWSREDGDVRRCYGSEMNVNLYLRWLGFQNLSLIVDAVKPLR
jgi:predicted SAM-dependent methyltransferase